IMKIAYNDHLQALRKLAQQGRLANEYGGEQTARSAPDGPADEWPDAARMLAVLSDDERAAMVLSYAHGMSHGEVAEIIGMPLGTVKSHLHRAKAKIRSHFALDGAASDRGATPPRGR